MSTRCILFISLCDSTEYMPIIGLYFVSTNCAPIQSCLHVVTDLQCVVTSTAISVTSVTFCCLPDRVKLCPRYFIINHARFQCSVPGRWLNQLAANAEKDILKKLAFVNCKLWSIKFVVCSCSQLNLQEIL